MASELSRRVEDLYQRAYRRNQEAATNFLDPAEQSEADRTLRTLPGARTLFIGGFEEAERRRLIFLPDYLDRDTLAADEYLHAVRVTYSHGTLTHRDFLGSLMGLGIKRETLGDILVSDTSADIICTPQISAFIADNLIKVGRLGVKTHFIPLSEIQLPNPEFKTVSGTVASPRADAVTALAFGISRTAAADLIRDGRLAVDHLEQLSPSADIPEGALLSLRGHGRARLSEIGGTSKKGRIFLEMQVFAGK